jgi:HPr kinase/phosphorylase
LGANHADTLNLHATTIAVGEAAMAITGPAGIGKTSLALACLTVPTGDLCPVPPRLVADDRTHVTLRDGLLVARAPDNLIGLVEMRGLGIVRIEPAPETPLVCTLKLTADAVPRLPAAPETSDLLGVALPVLTLTATDPALPAKALAWLAINAGRLQLLETDRTLPQTPPRGG